MIRRALIARRKEKERDSLRYTREEGYEDQLVDVEAIDIEEAEKLSACDENTEDTLSTLVKKRFSDDTSIPSSSKSSSVSPRKAPRSNIAESANNKYSFAGNYGFGVRVGKPTPPSSSAVDCSEWYYTLVMATYRSFVLHWIILLHSL
uniref:Uncharacterized protein n=1 Tax=Amphimedon queenslandica TaxID=400682 RepID=A0A1X7VQN2_AMPQE